MQQPFSNDLNQHFYRDIKLDLKELASSSGLSNGVDILKLKGLIEKAQNILEIGSGYGRAAEFISKYKTSRSNLFLIEVIDSYIPILTSKFKKTATILHQDLKELVNDPSFSTKFDLILWMWSGFADFNVEEQKQHLVLLNKSLKKDGVAVIDLPFVHETNANQVTHDHKGHTASLLKEAISPYRGHIPSVHFLKTSLKEACLILHKTNHYQTDTQRRRIQYFIKHA